MTKATRSRVIAFSTFAAWLAVVLWVSLNHAVWRDEVRALSKALAGDNVLAMVKSLHPEGHPALWYLLLRGAHAVLPRPQVLQLIALPVAATSALLLVLYSPFDWWVKALLLAGKYFIFEYSVMSRNYGISMLFLFLLAVFYKRHRERGPLLGILLFLLANCSAPSVLLVGGFLLFWLLDVLTENRATWPRALRTYAWNTAIAMAGIAVCMFTILPAPQRYTKPLQTLANGISPLEGATASGLHIGPAWKAVLLPGTSLSQLIDSSQEPGSYMAVPQLSANRWLLSALLFGSTLGLIRSPAALLAALTTLIAFSLFFTFVYTGFFRHQALWLCFLLVCYWMARDKQNASKSWEWARFRTFLRPASTVGWLLFLLLMAIQAQIGVVTVYAATVDGPPFSCSRDLAELIASRPDLHDAILIAEPDYMLESLPYYLTNPTYYVRNRRFASFTRINGSVARLTLDDLLATARRLHAETNKPVVVLVEPPLDLLSTERVYREAHAWDFVTTSQQIRDFTDATQSLESFPAALTDEKFDVYLLK